MKILKCESLARFLDAKTIFLKVNINNELEYVILKDTIYNSKKNTK